MREVYPDRGCMHTRETPCERCSQKAETYRAGAIVGTHSVKPARDGEEVDAGRVDPAVIAGRIRVRAERIVERFGASTMPDALIDDYDDAQRILALLDELDSAILQDQLRASLRKKP